jgi:NADPH2:quinone reductase
MTDAIVLQAIVLRATGGPEVLRMEPVELGRSGPGQVRLRHTAIGVNYHDVYIRDGSYAGWMSLPGGPGVAALRMGRSSRRDGPDAATVPGMLA